MYICKCSGSDTSSSRSETASPSTGQCTPRTCADQPSRGPPVNHTTATSYRRPCVRGGGHSRSGEAKTTRIRTVLNEKQLHTLRTCYSANSRPDALMKEQLVEMTGLSPRVIRVWFQNKRCKDKKRNLALKQLHQQQQNKVPVHASHLYMQLCITVRLSSGTATPNSRKSKPFLPYPPSVPVLDSSLPSALFLSTLFLPSHPPIPSFTAMVFGERLSTCDQNAVVYTMYRKQRLLCNNRHANNLKFS